MTLPVATPAGLGGATVVIGALMLRWLAGIAENAGASGLSEATAMAMLAVMGLLFLLDFRLSRPALFLTAGLAGWAVAGTASLLGSPPAAPVEALALLALLALYMFFANACHVYLRDAAALRLLGRFLVAFLAIGGLLAAAQMLTGHGFVEAGKDRVPRAFGSDVHPVSFGIQIVVALTGLEIVRLKLGGRRGPGFWLAVALGVFALYLSLARTAWAMAVLIPALAALSSGRPALRMASLATLGLGALGLALSPRFADLASLPQFIAGFSFSDAVFDYRFIDNSVSWRVVNWAYGMQQALESPLLGHGPGQSASASYFHLEMHNIFLETFFEGGVIGLGAFLLTLVGLARLHLRLPRDTLCDRRARSLANGLGMALFLAVTLSTSLVDQLMTVLIYVAVLAATAVPARTALSVAPATIWRFRTPSAGDIQEA